MLLSLLSSKESESKAGGLNILGSFCGLSYDFTKVKISKSLDFFKKNSQFISLSTWQLVFDLQDDWDITIKEASVVLIQLCAPRDAVKYFDKVKREKDNLKFSHMLNRYGMGGDQSSRGASSSRGELMHSAVSEEADGAGKGNWMGEEMMLKEMMGEGGTGANIFEDRHRSGEDGKNQYLADLIADDSLPAKLDPSLLDLDSPFHFFVDEY